MSNSNLNIGNSRLSNLPSSKAPPKRRRLNFACNYCRGRKSRCDEQKPACRACLAAGIPCVTTDRRRPGVPITRHEAGAPPSIVMTSPEVQTAFRRHSPIQTPRGAIPRIEPSVHCRAPSATVPLTPRSASETNEETHHATTWKPPRRVQHGNTDVAADMHAETDHINQTTKFSGRLPMLRSSNGNCTSEMLTDWLDLAFHRLGIKKRLSPMLAPVEPHVPMQQPILSPDPPPLPDSATCQELLFLYLEETNVVFPLLDAAKMGQMLDVAVQLGSSQFAQEHGFLPLLLIYMVLSLGALSHEGSEWRTFSATNLHFCRSFVGHMVGWNTLQAVQVMFLLSLCLKSHDQISAAWSILSLCVSMAMSMSLNRPGSLPQRTLQAQSQLQSLTKPNYEVDRLRTWWCIYCYERLFTFELGRPPLILDEGCQELDLGSWSFSTNGRSHPRPPFLRILGKFADLLGEIGRLATRSRNTEDTAGSSGIDMAIRDKVKTIGESCSMLMKWADSLPHEYRPRSDFIYDTGSFPFVSFISFMYNQALLMLMRNSLLVSNKAIQLSIDNVANGTHWENIIRNGPSIAINAARRTIYLLIEASDSDVKPLLPSLSVPLHALYILSINIIRHPRSRMAKSDLNLINDGSDFAKQQDEHFHSNGRLHAVLDKLDTLVKKVMTTSPTQNPGAKTPGMEHPVEETVRNMRPQAHTGQVPAGSLGHTYVAHSYDQYDQAGMANLDFTAIFGESPALSQDADCSPEVTHDIGWDWVDFTQLFPETMESA